MDFEADLDSSFEMLGNEVIVKARENEPTPPPAQVRSSVSSASSLSRRPPSMPTILEEEEGGDVSVTPRAVQRAFLSPDMFARSLDAAAGAFEYNGVDSESMETPRPRG
jgi:hypothetical protein